MNANAAILDNNELAAIEREEAEKLAPEIVRDLEREHQEPIADKLPAELASISEQVTALEQAKAEAAEAHRQEIARLMAEHAAEQADYDAQIARLMNQVLRRVAVKEQMLDRKTAAAGKLLNSIDALATCLSTNVEAIRDSADEAAAENHQTEEYGRLYREQYEHAPEPPDDDGGSRVPVAQRDRETTDALDDGLTDLVQRMKRHGGGQISAPSLRTRVMNVGRAMLNPEQFIRRNASPPYRAA